MTEKEKLIQARSEVNINPSEGQKEAGNYKMGHVKLLGFDITIENPKGSYRKGKDRNGKEWKVQMKYDYGYFTKTLGYDGDAVDVFVGNNLNSNKIFAIDQFINGKFDETKFMLGFNSKDEAKKGYFANYEKNWKGFKEITEININDFKHWLYNGKQQRKPFFEYKGLKKYFITEAQKILLESARNKHYVNMNVELRKGGRNAVKMSVEDFKREMEHTYHEYCIEQNIDVTYSCHKQASVGHFVYSCCYGSKTNSKSKIIKDLYNDIWGGKYKFDSENVDNRGDIKMSSKGFPYIEVHAGGDWECPVCFFVYFDGNKFRGYVPLKGNAICRDNNSAFGNDYYKEDSVEVKFLKKEFGVKTKEELPVEPTDINYNIDACLEDFLSRVEVKGSYKKRDHSKDEKKFDEYKKQKEEEKAQKEAEKEELTECKKLFLTEKQFSLINEEFENNKKVIEDSINNVGHAINDPDSVTFFNNEYRFKDSLSSYIIMPFLKCNLPLIGEVFLFGEPFKSHNVIRNRIIEHYIKNEESVILKRIFKADDITINGVSDAIRDYLMDNEQSGRFYIIDNPYDGTRICIFGFWSIDMESEAPNSMNIRELINHVIEEYPIINDCSLILVANGSQPYYVFDKDSDSEISIDDNSEQQVLHNLPAEEKWKQTKAFRDEKEKILGDKLQQRDHEGNKTGKEMTLAQYNALRYLAEEKNREH